jgi:hypothetical protein
MTRRLVLIGVTLVLAWIYMLALVTVIGHAAALRSPSWWNALFSSRVNAILSWMVTVHTFAVLAVSLPCAFLIERMYGRSGVLVAMAVTVTLYASSYAWAPFREFGLHTMRSNIITIFDAIKLIGFLPALVWVLGALPSNNRMERPREP